MGNVPISVSIKKHMLLWGGLQMSHVSLLMFASQPRLPSFHNPGLRGVMATRGHRGGSGHTSGYHLQTRLCWHFLTPPTFNISLHPLSGLA